MLPIFQNGKKAAILVVSKKRGGSAVKLSVHMKDPASRRAPVKTVELEIPGRPGTLRELIRSVSAACAAGFDRRAEAAEVLSCLTQQELEGQARTGKVSFGAVYGEGRADPDKAADTAVQCFEDGIFRVFQGRNELEALDGPVDLADGEALTFVRLTMLAGRMW